jgi:hypothetical protein
MSSNDTKPMLALPARAEETVEQIGVDDTYKLKELGPVGKSEKKTDKGVYILK